MSGLVIMPGAILNGIMSVYTGKIYDKYGPRLLILIGFIILIVTTASLSFLKYDSSYTMLVVVYAIRMFAVSLLMMPINTAGINALRNEDISHGTAIMNFGRVMGSLGTTLMVTFMSIGAKIRLVLQVRTMKYYKDRVLRCRFIVCNSYWSCNYRLYFLFIYQRGKTL